MKTTSKIARVAGAILFVAAGCGSEAEHSESTEWAGAEQHFRAQGQIEGEDIDIDLGADVTSMIGCELEYEVEKDKPETLRMVEAKIHALVGSGDKARQLELELKYHDLSADKLGTSIRIVPRDDQEAPSADELVCEWEWHSWDAAAQTDVEELLEVAALEGDVVLEMFDGLPETGAPLPNQVTLGATIAASWSVEDSLTISFTAPCTDVTVTVL